MNFSIPFTRPWSFTLNTAVLFYEPAVCQLTFTSTKCVTFEYSLWSLNEMNIWKVFLFPANTVFGTVNLLMCEIVMETPISILSRRRWRQQERQKGNRIRLAKQKFCGCITLFCTFIYRRCMWQGNRIRLAKQQFCECITLFCTFLCRHCTTTMWKCLISRQRLPFFFSWTSVSPFRSSPGLLYQNEVKCWGFDIEMMFHSQANTTHFHKKDYALGLILKVRIFETRKWPILLQKNSNIWRTDWDGISTIKFKVTFLVTFT